MNRREVREVLAAHADGLNGGSAPFSRNTVRNARVQGLLDLAEQLNSILVPVAPDAHYRRRLHGELILGAQERDSGGQLSMFEQHRRGILIGAAAVGSVASVVGVIIAFFWRLRHGRAAHIATG
jgi:hypothetical protein